MALSLDQTRLFREHIVNDWLKKKVNLCRSSQFGKSVTRSSERIALPALRIEAHLTAKLLIKLDTNVSQPYAGSVLTETHELEMDQIGYDDFIFPWF